MGGRDFLLNYFEQRSVGAEVGVWKARFSRRILELVNPRTLYLIDPWKYRPDYGNEIYAAGMSQQKMNRIYRGVLYLLQNDPRVKIRRLESQIFLPRLPDNHLDWIYIDGDHHYKMVKQDLKLSFPKVRVGGYITGDDYDQGHHWWGKNVVRAVMEFVRENKNVEFVKLRNTQFILMRTG